jgi:hypothetical protein
MVSHYRNRTHSKHDKEDAIDEKELHARIYDFYAGLIGSNFTQSRLSEFAASDSKLKLVHITKTAGTALEQWGAKHGFSWGFFWSELSNKAYGHPPHFGAAPWHTPPRLFQRSPYDGYEMFAVVRDPYARIISEFRCPWTGFCCTDGSTPEVKKTRRAQATVNDLNAWVLEKLGKGKARPPFHRGHLVPQHMYIFREDGSNLIKPENVLRMERLDEDFKQLRERHNIKGGPLERINESDVPKFQVSDLSPAARKFIEQEYSEDFKRFGY